MCVVHSVRRQHKKFLMRALVSSLPTAQEVARQQQLYRVCWAHGVILLWLYTPAVCSWNILCWRGTHTSYEFECTRVHQIITEASPPSSARQTHWNREHVMLCSVRIRNPIPGRECSACMHASQNQLRADSQISHSSAETWTRSPAAKFSFSTAEFPFADLFASSFKCEQFSLKF